MIGAELTKLDDWTLKLLTNTEVLHLLSNDCIGKQELRNEKAAVWSCLDQMSGTAYIALFNLKDCESQVSCNLAESIQLSDTVYLRGKELWSNEEILVTEAQVSAKVAAHGVKLYRLEK